MHAPAFEDEKVAAKFASYPEPAAQMLLTIRNWIFELASANANIGKLGESLKWGEPAWRPKSGVGTTIRADWKDKSPDCVKIFFDCKTDLIDLTRSLLSADLECKGNRAIVLPLDRPLPEQAVKTALGWALSYHSDRKGSPA